ncbi:MAG: hypothetical protein J7K72_03640 [Candidatus Aenigmarchaeota archaeon]|nr:hypothetical protein [Candidatus Aenigmarchaeota archaeon]
MEKVIRKLFMDLYRGFPNGRVSEDIVRRAIVAEADRKFLVEHGFLLEEEEISNGKRKKYYNLGPNALQLISSWRIERLSTYMLILTVIVVIATIIGLLF